MPPYEEDGYQTAQPAITFTIERIVVARRNEIYRAWTDPELFKRWIVPPDQELVSFSTETEREYLWETKAHADVEPVEFVFEGQTYFPYRLLEAWCFVSTVPGMLNEHPLHILLTLEKHEFEGGTTSTGYKLELRYHHATLWRYTSRVDLHTFWLEATERLTRLVEQSSILRETAA
ncbi:UNVERIFIED_ORG: hypothetical protein J2W75_003254 [Methylorubrum zatmanii]|uniref:hypothetical protein n=1 Tax=Methylorubrum extorquens TaxID=408 RepID=UPI0020A2201D|nr:hypothetical protein [Methylorubrum extorquens]MCP1557929.1 hypothetical protein [Methylorubrum extorquens]